MDSSTSNETYNASPNQMTPNPMRLGSLGAFAPPDEIIFLIFLLSLGSLACGADKDIAKPFALTVVPALSLLQGRSITIADDKASEFYVVLTNASRNPQPVFEYWNSWGSGAVSFELTTPDGKKVVISKGTEVWTVNKPSTFLIPPGEHQVYVIRLDKRWETRPKLTADADARTQITFKAIYQVTDTPEATKQRVWTGRIESKTYDFTLPDWRIP